MSKKERPNWRCLVYVLFLVLRYIIVIEAYMVPNGRSEDENVASVESRVEFNGVAFAGESQTVQSEPAKCCCEKEKCGHWVNIGVSIKYLRGARRT